MKSVPLVLHALIFIIFTKNHLCFFLIDSENLTLCAAGTFQLMALIILGIFFDIAHLSLMEGLDKLLCNEPFLNANKFKLWFIAAHLIDYEKVDLFLKNLLEIS